MVLKQLLWVFVGGGLGACLRFFMAKIPALNGGNFPWSTFIANMLGCFLIGLLSGWLIKNDLLRSNTGLFLLTGFCGGLTTFSTCSNESLTLLRHNPLFYLIVYNLSSLGLGIIFVGLGYFLLKINS